jgi:hypothetical protein
MHMLYNSENFAVVQFEIDLTGQAVVAFDGDAPLADSLKRGGYEIVDKHTRREIYLEGAVAEHFKQGVQELFSSAPGEDEIDDYLSGFTVLAQHPVVLH